MRTLAVIISKKDARVVLLASTCTSVSGAVRKAMGVLTAQVRTRSNTAGAFGDRNKEKGWVGGQISNDKTTEVSNWRNR